MVAVLNEGREPLYAFAKMKGLSPNLLKAWEVIDGGKALRYPVLNSKLVQLKINKELVWRIRSLTGGKRFSWQPKKPSQARYYIHSAEQLEAIKREKAVWIVEGETDVLTMIAAGIPNVIAWYDGAHACPDTISSDLAYLAGAKPVVHIFMDNDHAGYQGAVRLAKRLSQADVQYDVYLAPEEVKDANELWVSVGGDAHMKPEARKAFRDKIRKVSIDYLLYLTGEPRAREAFGEVDYKKLYSEWREGLLKLIRSRESKTVGGVTRYRCPMPGHKNGDQHPSLRILDTGAVVCSCGVQNMQHPHDELARVLNYPVWDDYKREHAPKVLTLRDKKAHKHPDDTVPTVLSPDDAVAELEAMLNGDGDVFECPLPFPSLGRLVGGAGAYVTPGMLLLIGSVAGAGKTVLALQTCIREIFSGRDVILFSPEWSAGTLLARIAYMHGGLPPTAVKHISYIKLNKDSEFSIDKLLSPKWRASNPEILRSFEPFMPRKERGDIQCLTERAEITKTFVQRYKSRTLIASGSGQIHLVRTSTLKGIIAEVTTIVNRIRDEGRSVRVLVVDYLNRIIEGANSDYTSLDKCLLELQSAAKAEGHGSNHWGVSIVAFAQVRKNKKDELVHGDKDTLNASDLRGVTDYYPQFFAVLVPEYDNHGLLTGGVLKVVKNNEGRLGELKLVMRNFAWRESNV